MLTIVTKPQVKLSPDGKEFLIRFLVEINGETLITEIHTGDKLNRRANEIIMSLENKQCLRMK